MSIKRKSDCPYKTLLSITKLVLEIVEKKASLPTYDSQSSHIALKVW